MLGPGLRRQAHRRSRAGPRGTGARLDRRRGCRRHRDSSSRRHGLRLRRFATEAMLRRRVAPTTPTPPSTPASTSASTSAPAKRSPPSRRRTLPTTDAAHGIDAAQPSTPSRRSPLKKSAARRASRPTAGLDAIAAAADRDQARRSPRAFRKPGDPATLPELIKFLNDRSGYIRALEEEATPESFSRIENLKELANAAQDAQRARRDAGRIPRPRRAGLATPTPTPPKRASR